MEKSNAFFKLQERRSQIEESIEEFNNKIKVNSEQAKIKTMNYCMNTVFYS